jgi:hypothetical protein
VCCWILSNNKLSAWPIYILCFSILKTYFYAVCMKIRYYYYPFKSIHCTLYSWAKCHVFLPDIQCNPDEWKLLKCWFNTDMKLTLNDTRWKVKLQTLITLSCHFIIIVSLFSSLWSVPYPHHKCCIVVIFCFHLPMGYEIKWTRTLFLFDPLSDTFQFDKYYRFYYFSHIYCKWRVIYRSFSVPELGIL